MAAKLTHIVLLSAALLGTALLVLPAPEAPPSSAQVRHVQDDSGGSGGSCASPAAPRRAPGPAGRNAFDGCADRSDD